MCNVNNNGNANNNVAANATYYITDTGKIIKKPAQDSIVRQRKKMKKQAGLVAKGLMTSADVLIGLVSWIGSMIHRHSRKTVFNMKKLYKELFEKE